MKIVSGKIMSQIDQKSQENFGIPSILLMESAGTSALRILLKEAWNNVLPHGRFVFLCGKGNNGGDAMVMAREILSMGKMDLAIILVAGAPKNDSPAMTNLEICKKLGIQTIDMSNDQVKTEAGLESASVIFDGIFGTGFSGEMQKPIASIIEKTNRISCIKIAIDNPSGLGESYRSGDIIFQAEYTLAMGLPKDCMYFPSARPMCGKIMIIPVCFPKTLLENPAQAGILITHEDIQNYLKPVALHSYKKNRGHISIFAGTAGLAGAAILASRAASRSRTGLVTVYTDSSAYASIASQSSSVMVRDYTTAMPADADIKSTHTAILVGPGFGLLSQQEAIFYRLVKSGLPIVIDADAITLLTRLLTKEKLRFSSNAIITPHPGELSRLTGLDTSKILENPMPVLKKTAADLEAFIVLKTHVTFIVSPDGSYYVYDGMNPAMGTGGSGDVLAGLIAGLLASGLSPLDAACCGVLVHGKAGLQAFKSAGWFVAEDLIPFISNALK
ncbi:MAG: NAD(P)H-hydrate dehydratase [Spirochaetaceae bacterium]|nr:MAG: NAD(P)H-hydrate dehydratase [Spirochaetaceae bacterium]